MSAVKSLYLRYRLLETHTCASIKLDVPPGCIRKYKWTVERQTTSRTKKILERKCESAVVKYRLLTELAAGVSGDVLCNVL